MVDKAVEIYEDTVHDYPDVAMPYYYLGTTYYRMGYLNKIRLLLEKGTSNPLPVILDRFFTAPHLASGTPEQITLSLWKELDEIRSPSLVVERWLESGDDKVVNEMIAPFTKRDLVSVPPDEKVILEELSSITLEDFFASLEQ